MKRLKRLLAVIMAIICAGSIANFDVKAEGLKINEKHKKARKRVKRYNHNLIQLLKMYEKEK